MWGKFSGDGMAVMVFGEAVLSGEEWAEGAGMTISHVVLVGVVLIGTTALVTS